ncbi:MAG: ATP-grasp domain-containing protein [Chloroflexi bacterium]|nr:ATP-grasp domain-containing protein [Chloroflexota bacterium]
MKKVLIIGAGRLQVPAYETAKRLGIASIAVDRNPKAPGMALADAAYPVDTRDVPGIVDIAKREHVSGVTTLCTDRPVRAVAEVGAELGLVTLSRAAAAAATHKGLMRDAFANAGVPCPRYRRVHSREDAHRALMDVGLPAILKPTESSGSRGIFKLTRAAEFDGGFAHALAVAGPGGEILVEEFVDGPEVSVETLSFEGRHEVVALTDKRTTGDPHWVETGHVEPCRLPSSVQGEIRKTTVQGLAALGIDSAAGHVELKVGKAGPQIIEIGARLGGDFITTELVKRSTGVDLVEAILNVALGRTPDVSVKKNRGAAIRYLNAPAGLVSRVDGADEARRMPGVCRLEIDVSPGEPIGTIYSSLDRPGFVICEGSDADEAERRASAAAACIVIQTVAQRHDLR